LFSEPRDDDDEEDQEAADNDEADAREGDGDGDMGRKPAAAVLPANVKLILDTMKITRMDKVWSDEFGLWWRVRDRGDHALECPGIFARRMHRP